MTNLVQSIIRNTRHSFQIKFGMFSNRAVLHEGIFQRILQALHRHFFVFGIFTPVGVHSVKGVVFTRRGIYNYSFDPILNSIRPRRSFLNEKEIINFNIGGGDFDDGVHLAGVGG